jgi:hypothetical protein
MKRNYDITDLPYIKHIYHEDILESAWDSLKKTVPFSDTQFRFEIYCTIRDELDKLDIVKNES